MTIHCLIEYSKLLGPGALWLLPAFQWFLPPTRSRTLAPTHYSWISKHEEVFQASVSMKMLFFLPAVSSPDPPFCLMNFYLFSNDPYQKNSPLVFLFTHHLERNSSLLCVSKVLVALFPASGPRVWRGSLHFRSPPSCLWATPWIGDSWLSSHWNFSQVTSDNLPSSPLNHFSVVLSSELSSWTLLHPEPLLASSCSDTYFSRMFFST